MIDDITGHWLLTQSPAPVSSPRVLVGGGAEVSNHLMLWSGDSRQSEAVFLLQMERTKHPFLAA